MKVYFDLFWVFCKISLFTVGGGLAMLPLVEREVTDTRRWLDKEEFLDIFGISQSMPGVMILNVATTVGYKMCGVRGALAAAAGTVCAPFFVILLAAWFFLDMKGEPVVMKIFAGIRPAVMALVTIPVITLSRAARIQGIVVLVPAAVVFVIGVLRIHPAYVIFAGAGIMAVRILCRRKA